MNRIQHLAAALIHLSNCEGFSLEIERIRRVINDELDRITDELEGTALIDRLTDQELAIAIQVKNPRLNLDCGGHLNPSIFNYIRHHRPLIAAQEFGRKT